MLFSAKVGEEIRPMNELSVRRIEDLPTRSKVGWGGEEKIFFPQKCNVRGNACSFMRTLLFGDKNGIMP